MTRHTIQPTPGDHYHFVTGKLAEPAVRRIVHELSQQYGFDYSIGVMPITVAALMTPRWLSGRLQPPAETTHVIVPGFCESGIEELSARLKPLLVVGPRDCREMSELFGGQTEPPALDRYNIQIIAEINHAPRFSFDQILAQALQLRDDGADMIDIGCDPSKRFEDVGQWVGDLVAAGLQVSIDTFDPWEAAKATGAGASLVLSVNSTNRQQACDWGTEVVVIPDTPRDLDSLDQTIEYLARRNVPMRLDPILEPIGAGLADSLVRYADCRRRYPELPMMMGIGNLTELTDVDSAGINLLLLGICEELQIHSVLTTQVINWARTSVRECDMARRLTAHSVAEGVPPKNLSEALVMLRDRRLRPFPPESLTELAQAIKDNNYRIFAQDDQLHLLAAGLHLSDEDPFRLFERLMSENVSDNVDAGHAFYLGYEMAKASIALTLGKQYEQDRALNWGMLTRTEDLHRIKRTSRHRKTST
ncbi:DUF6513 domain-containing protein [Stieleria varia]|uniref:Pterin binding enzyme n=1 Tax=Stieleria varia TaxID=2528005 RepID=A0A5C6B925_9BACT|nr:DUF6513 domain-containing protein [Stieleria varia]TWU07941.1 Pterin binding enzyme [Stieleria varia]